MDKLDKIETKKKELNLQLRELLAIIDFIDGTKNEYANYKANTLDEESYLNEQIKLAVEAKNRLLAIFKD